MDNRSWGAFPTRRTATYELPHDVQAQRGQMGAIGRVSSLRQLEVSLLYSCHYHSC